MNIDGTYTPIEPPTEESQVVEAPYTEPDFTIGEHITLNGKVIEISLHQGGETSVKVQLPSGAAWLRATWVERPSISRPPTPTPTTTTETNVVDPEPLNDFNGQTPSDNKLAPAIVTLVK